MGEAEMHGKARDASRIVTGDGREGINEFQTLLGPIAIVVRAILGWNAIH